MELCFLGTGAGQPSGRRNVTSVALRFADSGAMWLFDCGEATQHQVQKTPLKLSKLTHIWLTHLHGDHLFGLPGVLTSRSHNGISSPLTIYGPAGLARFVDVALDASRSVLQYELHIVELERDYWPEDGEPLLDDGHCRVYTARLDHRIECFGYRVEELERPGKLNERKLRECGVPPGPVYGQLKQGQDVRLPDGRLLRSSDFTGSPLPGRVVAVMGDTRPCAAAVRLARGADALVHEATFAEPQRPLAQAYYHSTSGDAAETAREADAKTLVLTHLSSRYQDGAEEQLLAEAQAIFPHTMIAEDLWTYAIAQKNHQSPIA